MVAPPGPWRWVVVLAAAWCLLRAPLGLALGLASSFSPALFYRPMLGVFSASAGSLVVLGLVLLLAAALLWRRGIPRRWWTVSAAALLVLAAPYLVRYFGRGIAPPAGGVSVGLWISWQLAVAAAGMALVFWAAALVRGTGSRGAFRGRSRPRARGRCSQRSPASGCGSPMVPGPSGTRSSGSRRSLA